MKYTIIIEVPHVGRLRAFLKRLWRAYGIKVIRITEGDTITPDDRA